MMSLSKHYQPATTEPRILAFWQQERVYQFSPHSSKPVYSIDSPPPTASGKLHLGHVYSYTHTDLIARFWRMKGLNVFYPMGFDDDGLPTERLVEKALGIKANELKRKAFIQKCLQISQEEEKTYKEIWTRLGLSIDWRYTYQTIDERSQKITQLSFLHLYHKQLAYRKEAPSIWCPACNTAIAQAEVSDIERGSEFITLNFQLDDGESLPIATTRPELLPACVAIFVHPNDQRFNHLVGQNAVVPLFQRSIPILQDHNADPEKGTGVVMCCTFGDSMDVEWWRRFDLPLIMVVDKKGVMTSKAGAYEGMSISDARVQIIADLGNAGLISNRESISQTVRVHERCDTPVEHLVTNQWFIKAMDFKQELLDIGEQFIWHPPHMKSRYRSWVENLAWDWCISRQRFFGVPIPVWYCDSCGGVTLPKEEQLPIDPLEHLPQEACDCGSTSFTPDSDVMDTWVSSSHSPQLAGQWLVDDPLYHLVYPMSLRPQAHEIIRTWVFYTVLQAMHHGYDLPWKEIAISGWGIAGPGEGKISKSRGGGPMSPQDMIERYSADAVRYWAASTGLGKDAIIDEGKIQAGAKLVNKLWNVARFSTRFLGEYKIPDSTPNLTPADRWILGVSQKLISRVTHLFENYDYAAAKSEIEAFFWKDFADNYLEIAKQRLYNQENDWHSGACFTLYHTLLTTIKLFSPFLPFITEEVFQIIYNEGNWVGSIHNSDWPSVDQALVDEESITLGTILVEIATGVRRFKSENNLPLGTELSRLTLVSPNSSLLSRLDHAVVDLMGVTRARKITLSENFEPSLESFRVTDEISVCVELLDR
jgi:valyl-tRNA synthetase